MTTDGHFSPHNNPFWTKTLSILAQNGFYFGPKRNAFWPKMVLQCIALLLPTLCWCQSKGPLPYPTIPDSITATADRVAFFLNHFWDGYAFDDHSADNIVTGEQRFVDYVNVLNQCDSAAARRSVTAFADSIAACSRRRQHYEQLAERYLTSADSPVRNLATYELLQWAMPAADITFTDDTCHRQRLFDADGDTLLVVFYDSQCDRCNELLPEVRNRHRDDGTRVVYIDMDIDNNQEVLDSYYLPTLPVFYLLDSNKRIIRKSYEPL